MESPGICDTCERVIDARLWNLFPNSRPTHCVPCGQLKIKLDRERREIEHQAARTRDAEYNQYLMIYPEMEKVPTWLDHYKEWLMTKDQIVKYEENPTPETFWYVFTLTTNNDEHTKDNLLGAAAKLFDKGVTHLNEPIIKGAYCLEYTEAGRPHIHGIYTTGTIRRLTNKSFQRAWKLWAPAKNQTAGGFKGGYHEKATNPKKYQEYIEKGDGEGGDAMVFIKE